jgi:hypothetical protein
MKQIEMQKTYPSDAKQKLEQFIIDMPRNIWYNTKQDEEIISIIKEWINGDYMWPKYFLVFNSDYLKFKKSEYILK